jgi:shikimate kinase
MTPVSQPRRGLALVGARGTGKTTVGRLVAERLGCEFVDLDENLEHTIGIPIHEVFTRYGEPGFRDLEEALLRDWTQKAGVVMATGGGVVIREANRQRLREFGFVVWLTAEPDVLAARLEADPTGVAKRPPLTAAGTLAEIAQVLAVRTPLYREVADAVVDTTERTPSEVAEAVLAVRPRDDDPRRGAP